MRFSFTTSKGISLVFRVLMITELKVCFLSVLMIFCTIDNIVGTENQRRDEAIGKRTRAPRAESANRRKT